MPKRPGIRRYDGNEAANIGMGQTGFDVITADSKTHWAGPGTDDATNVYHPEVKSWVFIRNITKQDGVVQEINNAGGTSPGDPVDYNIWTVVDYGDAQVKVFSMVGDDADIFLPQSSVVDGPFKGIKVVATIAGGANTATVLAYRG